MGRALGCSEWLVMVVLIAAIPVQADEGVPVAALDPADEALELADLILQHHIDPPTRQEMVLAAAKSLYRHAQRPIPNALSRDVSDAISRESLVEIVRAAVEDYCSHPPETALDWQRGNPLITDRERAKVAAREVIRQALLGVVPGEPAVTTVEEQRVAAQFESNRYVGTGIALRFDGSDPVMGDVFAGGPAARAGALAGDQIKRIDGRDTTGMPLEKVVSLLRGSEGSSVKLTLRQPNEEPRDVTITRGVVPLTTIDNYDLHRNRMQPTIAYQRITRIAASTVHELEQLGSTLHADNVEGLILDLRGLNSDSLHNTVLVADALLDGGTIGIAHYADHDVTFTAEPEELFPGMPLAILVNADTGDAAEWLAAALQDNRRAIVAGEHTSGAAFTNSAVPMPDGRHSLLLATAILMRGDGRPLLRPDTADVPSFGIGRIAVAPAGDVDSDAADKARPIPWGVTPDVVVETPTRPEDRWPDEFSSGRVVQAAVSRLRQLIRERGAVNE